MNCCESDETLADTKDFLSNIPGIISNPVEVKFRKPIGNMNYSTFLPGCTKLCNMLWGGGKFKLLSAGSGFTDQIFTGKLSRVDSAEALALLLKSV